MVIHAIWSRDNDFLSGRVLSPNTRSRSSKPLLLDPCCRGGWDRSGGGDVADDGSEGDWSLSAAATACSKLMVPSSRDSSKPRPARLSVLSPFSNPARPPKARNASRFLGLMSFETWPGEKANGLLSTLKASSSPGFGVKTLASCSYLMGAVVSELLDCDCDMLVGTDKALFSLSPPSECGGVDPVSPSTTSRWIR